MLRINNVNKKSHNKKTVPIGNKCLISLYLLCVPLRPLRLCGEILIFHNGFWDDSEEKTATNDRRHVLRPCWILKVRAKIYLSAFA